MARAKTQTHRSPLPNPKPIKAKAPRRPLRAVDAYGVELPDRARTPTQRARRSELVKPDYYRTDDPYEPFKIIDAYGLDFYAGSAIPYILRHGQKPGADPIEDLQKAITFLQARIDRLREERDA